MTADDLLKALSPNYRDSFSTVWLTEVPTRSSTETYWCDGSKQRRIDALSIRCNQSHRFEVIAYEVKVSRGDFRRDARNPHKRRHAMRWSNRFYYVVPAGLVAEPEAEVPEDCGLIEVREVAPGRFLPERTVVAPWRDTWPPTWEFLALVARRARDLAKANGEAPS